jgi:Ca-activated chloride channel family protein
LICIALLFFIIALARPLGGQAIQSDKNFGIDIVLAIDVSGSMLNVDSLPTSLPFRDFMGKRYYRDQKHELVKINRVNSAKNVIMDYINKQAFNRIGIVVFAGYSYTKCPLTLDKNMLINIVQSIDFNPQNDGTAIGMGIATSVNRLKKSEAKSRIIIILTDGINNSGMIDPLSAANIARDLNIRIYTIGLGNPEGYLQPAGMDFTDYELQIGAGLDEPILQKIAENTGGKFYRAYDPDSLKKIYDDIDKLEKSRIEIKRRVLYKENFFPFLVTGFIFLLAYIGLTNFVIKIP